MAQQMIIFFFAAIKVAASLIISNFIPVSGINSSIE